MISGRRNFLKSGTLAVSGTLLFSNDIFAAKKRNHLLGIQLYTVRDDMKKDPMGTLQQIAKMGYKNVEHANYADRKFYGNTAKEFKKILSDLGMKMPSGHTVLKEEHWDSAKNDFTDAWKYTVEDAATAGQQYVISPSMDESLRNNVDHFLAFMDLFNKCGELCKKSGMKFGYHNHEFEFKYSINNEKIHDIILKHTDPALVTQQLDTGNMYAIGGRAIDVIKKYPGRFELMHVKDEIKVPGEKDEKYESTILGKGVLHIKNIVDYALKYGGTTHLIIEQEAYQGKTPIESSMEDLHIMKKWGY
ncbi:MAG: sugar phosphate isomerase/epimerase [Ginsengibacter sp.]